MAPTDHRPSSIIAAFNHSNDDNNNSNNTSDPSGCTDAWGCTYLPLLIFYGIIAFLVSTYLVWRLLHALSDPERHGPVTWPPRSFRRDACLWPLCPLVFLLPAILWPVMLVLGIAYVVWLCATTVVLSVCGACAPERCCGVPLGSVSSVHAGVLELGLGVSKDEAVASAGRRESGGGSGSGAMDSYVAEPPPAYTRTAERDEVRVLPMSEVRRSA